MKTHSIYFVLIAFILMGCTSANLPKDGTDNIDRVESNRVDALLNAKKFEFFANTMFPMGQVSKDLTGDGYSVRFSPEKIISELPYYGVAYRGMPMGRDKGMRFKGEPREFSVSHSDQTYLVDATVQTPEDTFSLSLEVQKSGNATLTVTSKNRQSITYHGDVRAWINN